MKKIIFYLILIKLFSNSIYGDKTISKAKEISIEFLENNNSFLLKNGRTL